MLSVAGKVCHIFADLVHLEPVSHLESVPETSHGSGSPSPQKAASAAGGWQRVSLRSTRGLGQSPIGKKRASREAGVSQLCWPRVSAQGSQGTESPVNSAALMPPSYKAPFLGKKKPQAFLPGALEDGGFLLSHMVSQYHRRK